jgi:2'-5' RNA ligase
MNQSVEQLRLFIAIELPDGVKSSLNRIQDILKKNDPSYAKWVAPQGIHLTLKFLGNVDADKVEPITRAVNAAAREISPFRLEIRGLGAFPNLRRVQVIWAGIRGDLNILQMLQKIVESNLNAIGFPQEKRGFTPHLTLARLRETATLLQRQSLGELIAKTDFESNLIIKVNTVNLMRSQLMRGGAIYTCLYSAELNPSCQ